jgi:hypothetical protein
MIKVDIKIKRDKPLINRGVYISFFSPELV